MVLSYSSSFHELRHDVQVVFDLKESKQVNHVWVIQLQQRSNFWFVHVQFGFA